MITGITNRKLLAAIAAIADGADCSVAQIVVRTAATGFAVETVCERLEERGLITGSGPMVRRRYRLTEAGLSHLTGRKTQRAIAPVEMREEDFLRGIHQQTRAARALAWGEIRRLRTFTVQELIELVEARYPSNAKSCELYLYALVRAGIVRKTGHAARAPHQRAGNGPAIYRLPDDSDPGPLPVLWKSSPDIYLDRNSGRIFGPAKAAQPHPATPRLRPIASPATHHPGA